MSQKNKQVDAINIGIIGFGHRFDSGHLHQCIDLKTPLIYKIVKIRAQHLVFFWQFSIKTNLPKDSKQALRTRHQTLLNKSTK